MKDETINKAIDRLTQLTGEDFHGYRSEIWNVLADVYNSNRVEPQVIAKTPEAERLEYWERTAKEYKAESNYYQAELEKAHTILGRVIHQLSERWDTVNLTKYFPTDNLWRKRRVGNPTGEKR